MQFDSYLSEKQRLRRKRRQWLYIAAAFAVAYFLLVGIAWFFLRAPVFRVSQVTVAGNSAVSADDAVTLVEAAALRDRGFLYWKAILGYRNMLVWPSSLSAADLAFNPRLSAVTLSKDYWSHTITINVAERAPFGIWCFVPPGGGTYGGYGGAAAGSGSAASGVASGTAPGAAAAPGAGIANESCYSFDDTGFMFARTLDTQGNLIYVVHDYSQTGRGLAQSILPDEFRPNLISILNVVRASGASVNDIVLRDLSLEQVDVMTSGPSLYFSLRFPAANDLAVLQSLMQRPDFGKLQYVDFRVENRAYYK